MGFKIEWEHHFGDDSPLYMQVVREYHKELHGKQYKYNKPGLEQASWNAPCMTVIDPVGNKILFTEKGA